MPVSALNPREFTGSIQTKLTLNGLLEGALERQSLLLQIACNAAAKACGLARCIGHTNKDLVSSFNRQNGHIVRIYDGGVKSVERARDKLRAQHHQHCETVGDEDLFAEQLYDINRITVAPERPNFLDGFFDELAKSRTISIGDWNFFSSGYMDRLCVIELNGFAAEIRLRDPQTFEALELSTPLYQTERKMTGESTDTFHPPTFSAHQLLNIQDEYNRHMHRFSALNAGYQTTGPKDLRSFGGEFLAERFLELVALERSVFLVAIRNASKEWRDLWVTNARRYNEAATCEKQIPETELECIENLGRNST